MRNRSLEQFKLETAAELGIPNYDQIDKGLLPSRVNGMVGGMMVRKMIDIAESVLAAENQIGNNNIINYVHGVTNEDRQRVVESFQGMQMLMGTNQDNTSPPQLDSTPNYFIPQQNAVQGELQFLH